MSLFSLCCLRITTQLRSVAVDKMAGIFTKCVWQPCICQPNELKREIKKKTGRAKRRPSKNLGGLWPAQSPLRIATAAEWVRGAPKSPNNVTSTFFNTVHLLPIYLSFEHGGAKLASCPGRYLTSLHPCSIILVLITRNNPQYSCSSREKSATSKEKGRYAMRK